VGLFEPAVHPTMRIGVDATCWANPRGYGRFTREILAVMAELAPEDHFVCVVDRRAADCFDLRATNVETCVVQLDESPTRAASAEGYRSPADMLRLTRAVARERFDAFFSPTVTGISMPGSFHMAFGSDEAGAVFLTPEPETWSLLILGFGLVGWSLRRRSRLSGAALPGAA